MSEPDPQAVGRYVLAEAENRRIFTEEIVPELLADAVPQESPAVVFLIGQQGAGKTAIGHMITEQLARRGGCVDVDSDLYKPYHPDYDRLLTEDDTLMAAFTGPDGRAWMDQAHAYVRDHRLNALIQETAQNADYTGTAMDAYRQAGFRVEVLVLGVPKAMSDQGIIKRYHEQVKDRGSGRLTVQSKADASYHGILNLADLIEERSLAHRVAVHRRGDGQPRYSNTLDADGRWEQHPGLREAIETERDRPWSEHEAADFLRVHQELSAARV